MVTMKRAALVWLPEGHELEEVVTQSRLCQDCVLGPLVVETVVRGDRRTK